MLEKTTANHSLGVAVTKKKALLALTYISKSQPVIQSLSQNPLTDEEHVKPLYINEEQVSELSEKWLPVSNISSQDVLVRALDVKLRKAKDIESVLGFQAEPVVPYPTEEAVLDFTPIKSTQNGTLITLFSARHADLENHLDSCQKLQFEPEVTTCTPAALAMYGYYCGKTKKSQWPQFIIYIGEDESSCVLCAGGKLITSHTFQVGEEHIAAACNKDGSTELTESTPHIQEVADKIKLEIGRSLYALAKQSKVENIAEVLLCGPGAILGNLAEYLSKELKTTISLPQANFNASQEEIVYYALAIGNAFSGLNLCEHQVNFRQSEFAYPNPWKRYKKPIATYFGLCALLTLALYFFGNTWTNYQETKLKEEYAALLTLMDKPYSGFEREFTAKRFNIPETQEIDIKNIISLNHDELTNRIEYLSKEIRATPDVFPLLPTAPRVSDVLAWISTHPQVIDEEGKPLLNIESFSYTLVKRPDQKKKQEKYQYKVDIDFSTPIPKYAREFHDALIAPNDIVDPKSEVKWSQARDQYRTSFFLKNKSLKNGGK